MRQRCSDGALALLARDYSLFSPLRRAGRLSRVASLGFETHGCPSGSLESKEKIVERATGFEPVTSSLGSWTVDGGKDRVFLGPCRIRLIFSRSFGERRFGRFGHNSDGWFG